MRAKLCIVLCAGGLLAAAHPAAARAAQTGAPNDRLQVWNLNTHRMATSGTDYRNFVGYITDPARSPYYPDIITLQEAGTDSGGLQTPSCHNFETTLEQRTGVDYYCVETGHRGGAAIVYRTGRLSRTGTSSAIRLYEINTSNGACGLNTNDWYALAWRFNDDANAGKTINVGAIHLPTANFTTPDGNVNDCAWDNMKLVSPAVAGLGGSASMSIMAGDWNHADATANSAGGLAYWECWYSGMNADLGNCGSQNFGWKDAMYRACGWPSATSAQEYSCLHANHWTYGSAHSRIDFLFAKAYAIYNQVTVDPALTHYYTTLSYSDHRGQGALLRYY